MDRKNIATIILLGLFVLGLVWIIFFEGKTEKIEAKESNKTLNYDEIKGVWLSYLELDSILKGKSEKEFKKNMDEIIENMNGLGLNTMIVQVRAFSDAIYDSEYYPWSAYCTGEEGKKPNYDPLQIIIDKSHEKGIRVEAWINPYRIRGDNGNIKLSENNPGYKWRDKDLVIDLEGSMYYNPGREEVQELIVNGVKEIVEKYKVDGIHFDDYFYPSKDEAIDKLAYEEYKEKGGDLDLGGWRRENVNILVSKLYKTIKSINKEVVFGISPQGSLSNNYNSQFIDVEKWIKNPGYVDYICPQVYYGFDNESNKFPKVIKEFDDLIGKNNVKLYIGLAPYKIGKEDKWAGDGKEEWIKSNGIIKKQIEASRELSKYGGVVLFRYDSIFKPSDDVKDKIKNERDEIEKVLKKGAVAQVE